MKKNVWIFNHYATDMFFDEGGRHYWLGKELKKRGYQVTIFCANTIHKSDKTVPVNTGMFEVQEKEGIRFVFIKTSAYQGNGGSRIKNMMEYTVSLLRFYKKYGKVHGRPDVIYASSVHPLALYAGIKAAKHYKIKAICEIRDMWPLTLIEFGRLQKNSMMAKAMWMLEKWVFEKADELIFTMEGGAQYIKDMGWDTVQGGKVDIRKVHYINNGIDLDKFIENRENYQVDDADLKNENMFRVVYAGTLGQANRVDLLVDVAAYIQKKGLPIQFLIWGDGDKLPELQEQVKREHIENVVFKGRVQKKYIPYVTSQSDLNISFLEDCGLYKYGLSLNKMFDYIAAQKPFVIAGAVCNCQLLKEYPLCELCESSDIKTMAESVVRFYYQKREHIIQDKETLKNICDFSTRADELIKVMGGNAR